MSVMAFGDSTELLERCVVYASLGQLRLPSLRRVVEGAKADAELRKDAAGKASADWVRKIPLERAVKAGHYASSLSYLVEVVRVETVNAMSKGEAPLHVAVTWGRLDCAALLLARGGADPFLRNAKGETAAEKARVRQERLYESEMGMAPKQCSDLFRLSRCCNVPSAVPDAPAASSMYKEGLALLEFLDGIEAAGSWLAWARSHREHALVQRYEPKIFEAEPRLQLAVLRELVLEKRAVLSPQSKPVGAGRPRASSEFEPPPLWLPESEEVDGGEMERPKLKCELCPRARTALAAAAAMQALRSPTCGPKSPPTKPQTPALRPSKSPPLPPSMSSLLALTPLGTPALSPSSPPTFSSAVRKRCRGLNNGLAILFDEDLPDLMFTEIVSFAW